MVFSIHRESTVGEESFLYFAYGAHMQSDRMHISFPAAIKTQWGKLENHRLDFNAYSEIWKGANATIAAQKDGEVWGVIWSLKCTELHALDVLEGATKYITFGQDLDIKISTGLTMRCRTYKEMDDPTFLPWNQLPPKRRPSIPLLRTMCLGAQEAGLPQHYLNILAKIPNNGYDGPVGK